MTIYKVIINQSCLNISLVLVHGKIWKNDAEETQKKLEKTDYKEKYKAKE